MKTIWTSTHRRIERFQREKKIHYDARNPYFIFNGRRERLDYIPRLYSLGFFKDENGENRCLCGALAITNCLGLYVEVTPNETIQLWRDITPMD